MGKRHVERTAYVKSRTRIANAIMQEVKYIARIPLPFFHEFYAGCNLCIHASMTFCTGDTFVCAVCAHISSSRQVYSFLRDRAIFLLPSLAGAYIRLIAHLFFCPLCNLDFLS